MKKSIKLLVLLSSLLLVGCNTGGTSSSASSSVASSSAPVVSSSSVASSEASSAVSSVEESSSSEFVEDFTITAPEDAEYTISEGIVELKTSEKTYTFKGTSTSRIVIPSTVTKVTIELDGFELRVSGKKAIDYQTESSKLVISVKENTVNTIKAMDKTAISSENNIEVIGDGTLNIYSGKNGFSCSNFTAVSGTHNVKIEATENGIEAKQIAMNSGKYEFSNCQVALYADKNSKGAKGTVEVSNEIEVKDTQKIVYAETSLAIKATAKIKGENITVKDFDTPEKTAEDGSYVEVINTVTVQ